MSLRKRLRVLYAALTQQWSERRCFDCGFAWFTQNNCERWPLDKCAACEDRRYEEWISERIARKGVKL